MAHICDHTGSSGLVGMSFQKLLVLLHFVLLAVSCSPSAGKRGILKGLS